MSNNNKFRLQIEIQLKDKEILNMHKENIKNKDSKRIYLIKIKLKA